MSGRVGIGRVIVVEGCGVWGGFWVGWCVLGDKNLFDLIVYFIGIDVEVGWVVF